MKKCWTIPKELDSAFVANMEDVLSVDARPYNPLIPVICMDEKHVQMLVETRQGFRAANVALLYNNEYIHNGTASIFLFTEPLTG